MTVRGTTLYFDGDGVLHSWDERGNVTSPWDGVNGKEAPDPDARGDVRIGRLSRDGRGDYVFEGWDFDGKNRRLAGMTVDPVTLAPTHLSGWPIEELIALYVKYGKGATVPGRP